MAFTLSKRSQDRLSGVHPDLVGVVRQALALTQHDFGVTEGLRSMERQQDLVARGLSRTLRSRHLTGHAVDLVGYHRGRVTWDWPAYYMIADAMIRAAQALDIALRWGGAWHVADLRGTEMDAETLSADYIRHKQARGGRPFLDGPHFELSRAAYA
ncbi:MAG: M15 family metallopeptidase [Pseudomonadota bacterium]